MNSIILSTHTDRATGWGVVTSDIVASCKDAGHRIFAPNLPFLRKTKGILNRVSYILTYIRNFIRIFFYLWSGRFHCVICTTDNLLIYFALIRFSAPRKVRFLAYLHGSYANPNRIGNHRLRGFYRNVCKGIDLVFINSHYTLQRLRGAGLKLESVKILSPACHIRPCDSERAFEADAEDEGRLFVITMVGELKPRKGVEQLVLAVKLLLEREIPVRLHLVGNLQASSMLDRVKRYIFDHGLQESVIFEGRVSDQRKDILLRNSRALVMVSGDRKKEEFEGFGIVYIEANALGIPAIGYKYSGARYAIRNGKTGFLLESDSPDAIAECVLGIVNLQKSQSLANYCVDWANMHSYKRFNRVFRRFLDQ